MGRSLRRRQEELEERKENMPTVPEGFREWVEKELYKTDNHIYYKREGRKARFRCSACKAEYRKIIKRPESFEGLFDEVTDPPVQNRPCRCAVCGASGVYKADGRVKDGSVYGIRKSCYTVQKYKDGVVVRYFEIEKHFGKLYEQKYHIEEIARNFLLPGEKIIKDYRLQDFMGNIDWHDHNAGGLFNIIQEKGRVYPGSYGEMEGTPFAYTGLREYEKRSERVQAAKYLQRYQECPHMEMFEKAGLYAMVDYLVETGETQTIIVNGDAVRPADVLGIWPEEMKFLKKEKGSVKMLKILQTERRKGERWPEKAKKMLNDINVDMDLLEEVLEHMTVRKFLNRVERYAGIAYSDQLCTGAVRKIRTTAGRYLDYLHMRMEKGYDLHNTIFAYPADLERAHEQMVDEINAVRNERKKVEMDERYPAIREKYRELCRHYCYRSGELCIRPVRSGAEMVEEGRKLHHCVGGNEYLKKHNDGKSVILLLRHTDAPDTAYITVEMRKTEILQWYGAYDKKNDKETVEEWLKNYVRYLKKEEKMEKNDSERIIRAAG